ncbi:MAG TPA: type II toxin-antitoxin system RelE/ParE family toxin [Gemmataceae bacterium]|nr:type II toxin-antitoxin system RelE/ParE family toxin [Gemmataceae bacterium]
MDVEFLDKDLADAESGGSFPGRYSADIRKAFLKRLQVIRAAIDERDFYSLKSLHFEKLKGDRSDERSMRLNDQWRLILKIKPGNPKATVMICGIEDYH